MASQGNISPDDLYSNLARVGVEEPDMLLKVGRLPTMAGYVLGLIAFYSFIGSCSHV